MALVDVEGRVALITGGASGIGFGIARACGAAGMKLMLADVRAESLAQAHQALHAEGFTVETCRLDVADEAAWPEVLRRLEADFGALHLLCNNAGITGSGRPVAELDAAEWRRILDIDLTGAFLGVRHALPLIRRSGGGHVVNTASMAALLPYAGGAGYAAAKAGLLAFSETLRQELQGEGVGVSVLLPAQVRTPLFETSAERLAPDAAGDPMSRRAEARRSLEREGIDPLQVGRQVLDGVRAGRFHLFTHPQLRPVVAQRFEAMLAAMVQPGS